MPDDNDVKPMSDDEAALLLINCLATAPKNAKGYFVKGLAKLGAKRILEDLEAEEKFK